MALRHTTDVQQTPHVALCLAGAPRDFAHAWPSVRRNVVEPNGASVFIVISNQLRAGAGSRRAYAMDHLPFQKLVEIVGSPLRAAAVWQDEELAPSNITLWAGRAAANAATPTMHGNVYSWQYFLKRWACIGLVTADVQGPYDVVITMRPDLFVFQPWHLHVHKSTGTGRAQTWVDGDEARHDAHLNQHRRFSLTVGNDSAVAFGPHEVVMHDFTFSCTNDWVAISSMSAAMTMEQTIHHLHAAHGFVDCPGEQNCCEPLFGAYLWRIGLPHKVADLHVEMVRKLVPKDNSWSVWPGNEAFERKRRTLAHMWGGTFNAYCKDPAYADYGDMHLAEDDSTFNSSLPSRKLPGVTSPYGNRSKCGANVSQFPPCADTVDLQQPLKPCVRRTLSQRVAAKGQGLPFPWWHMCGDTAACEPLPNAWYVSKEGNTQTAAQVWPGRPPRRR